MTLQLRILGLSVNFDRTRECQCVIYTTAHIPIIQASHVTPSPIKSSFDEQRSDYSGVTRKSNARKAVTP